MGQQRCADFDPEFAALTSQFDAPFDDVCSYAPAPLLCLRTLKAELGCGMPKDKTDRAKADDPTWLTDGKWGVVHFAPAHQD